jgi:predicted 3-demethylubiquinone-9 3-methyltransferase (glyoxalase superfamily)
MTKPIYPCLWFDNQARAAADFYCTVFPNSKILVDNGLVVNFELDGQLFMGLNGGPKFHFNEALSFVIPCKDQAELMSDPARAPRVIASFMKMRKFDIATLLNA